MAKTFPFHWSLAGSGLNLTFYAGGLEALEEAHLEPATIRGVSGGAIIGAAKASGLSAKEIQDLLLEFMPPLFKMMNVGPIQGASLLWSKGLDDGKRLEEILAKHLTPLFAGTRVPFACFTTNMNKPALTEWSSQSTPGASLPTRVVDSARLPVVFTPGRIKGEDHRDGGLFLNYPIDFKFRGQQDLPTIGFLIQGSLGDPLAKIDGVVGDLSRCLDLLLAASSREHVADAAWADTIVFGPAGSAFDFMKSREKAKADFKSGRDSVRRWIDANGARLFPGL